MAKKATSSFFAGWAAPNLLYSPTHSGYHGAMSHSVKSTKPLDTPFDMNELLVFLMLRGEMPEDRVKVIEQAIADDPDIAALVESYKPILNHLMGVNLKLALMELGNQLVLNHGFDPCVGKLASLPQVKEITRSTEIIGLFTQWLNDTPEAQEILATLGINWPVVKGK